MRMRSYIGVTGIMTRAESVSLFEAAKVYFLHANRQLMIGTLASSKTLAGKPNRWPGRFPEIEDIADILFFDIWYPPRLLNLIHYSTDEPDTLYQQMKEVTERGGLHLNGIQLNVCWPDPDHLAKYRHRYPRNTLVLQVGKRAMMEVGSPVTCAAEVGKYANLIDYVLIDPSGGTGTVLNPDQILPYLARIRDIKIMSSDVNYPIGIGVGGGLRADNLHILEPLLAEIPDLCIDAEGQLRNELDNLDLEKACTYLRAAFQYLPRG